MSQLMDIWENPKGLLARRERYFDIHKLTNKEKEVCRLMLKGMMNQEIADLSETTLGTIKFYSSQIFEKFAVKSRAELFNLIFPT
jgi:DNA-binding NarL/FixJ family response regulator